MFFLKWNNINYLPKQHSALKRTRACRATRNLCVDYFQCAECPARHKASCAVLQRQETEQQRRGSQTEFNILRPDTFNYVPE